MEGAPRFIPRKSETASAFSWELLAEGTGASRADVWVRVGDELRAEAVWPQDADRPEPLVASTNVEGTLSSSSMREPVRHLGELLGALSITKKPGESITATEEKLVRDLAAQAGLVMRNVALAEQLMDTIEELRASRQRLVTAQDERAKQLERNLHDGAQQQRRAHGEAATARAADGS
jgi:transcriptional regulator with GAF, ATPase, and Fis domain